MIEWYKKVVFENYANFKGRARRSEYWYFVLLNFIISFALSFVLTLISPIIGLGANVYSFAVLIPSIAVAIRRMHDVGKSGWYILIPLYNLILLCTDSEEGTNEYGPNPDNLFDEIEDIGTSEG